MDQAVIEGLSVVRISVRNMVEFLLRSGDLCSAGYTSNQALHEGSRIHRRLQKEGGDAYQAEVRLSYAHCCEDFTLLLEGIADGIISTDEGVVLEEIKTTATPLERLEDHANTLHWAQAKCYAWMYIEQEDLPAIDIRLTYYHVESEEVGHWQEGFTRESLSGYVLGLLDQYAEWGRLFIEHQRGRDRSIRELPFPFPAYRRGQRELAAGVYRSIRDKRLLFSQAPTGTGKTISTLFPAVKALGEGMGERIFYLTAKTVTRQVAEQAVERMRDQGLRVKAITLTAKEKICLSPASACDPGECIYAQGHFDRVNEALLEAVQHDGIRTREVIEGYARRHRVCPFELGLDLSLWMDCIICDYNYVFDPRAYLRRFFEYGGDFTLLIDEAHNLVDRARDMYSAELSKKAFLSQRQRLKERIPKACQALGRINKLFIELRKGVEGKYQTVTIAPPAALYEHVEEFVQALETYMGQNRQIKLEEDLMELFFSCLSYMAVYKLYDERYVTYITREDSELKLKLFCIDPSFLLRKACKKGRAAVFFSGTLEPLPFYQELLGGGAEDRTIRLVSPFTPEHLCLMVAGNISTRYKDRQDSYDRITQAVHAAVTQRTGNYMVFFPSFEYMRHVYGLYQAQ